MVHPLRRTGTLRVVSLLSIILILTRERVVPERCLELFKRADKPDRRVDTLLLIGRGEIPEKRKSRGHVCSTLALACKFILNILIDFTTRSRTLNFARRGKNMRFMDSKIVRSFLHIILCNV
jgi:hypothetical protein